MGDFRFNHDLLVADDEQAAAKQSFALIWPALIFPELVKAFMKYESEAKHLKQGSRLSGFTAVVMVAFALAASAATPLYETRSWAAMLAFLAGGLGVLGFMIGSVGLLHSRSKRRWLDARYGAERLRQLHFQTMVARWPMILEAAKSGDWGAYRQRRNADLATVVQTIEAAADARISMAISDADGSGADSQTWLVTPQQMDAGDDLQSPAFTELRSAYRQLRLDGQRTYAQTQIRSDAAKITSNRPGEQLRWLRGSTWIIILAVAVLHAVAGVLAIFTDHHPLASYVHIAAVCLAIAGLGLRALEEGLQPAREVERYRGYSAATRDITLRFSTAQSAAETLSAMREMEQVSYSEMIAFLKSNREARFTM